MPESLVTICYVIASALFILSLGGLSHPKTARRGNLLGLTGMGLALLAATASDHVTGYALLGAILLPAAAAGWVLARRVKMTQMPQLVAILHSFVGAAAVLVALALHLAPGTRLEGIEGTIHEIEVFVAVCIGSVTFTGSLIAFGKLHGIITGAPLLLPARHVINIVLLMAVIWFGTVYVGHETVETGTHALLIATLLTAILGVHLIMAIGGADMPVVVSMLNSYSGWAAAAAGFMLSNDLLIITGALVGSSGAILSYIMCRGMNRSFVAVILGGFGTGEGSVAAASDAEGEVHSVTVQEAAGWIREARSVVVVPGYGMAVAQAQHALARIVDRITKGGTKIRFAIHPVAGRLPGHMNVLLAEANIPYDIVLEMDEINPDLPGTDLVLVIGANDIVNPSAEEDPDSPIAGMPVLEVWNSRRVVVMKRSMASGYAGVGNPLFFRDNTSMLFGDARENVEAILAAL